MLLLFSLPTADRDGTSHPASHIHLSEPDPATKMSVPGS